MLRFQVAPLLLLWITTGVHCQYDPYYGDSPFYGGPQPPFGGQYYPPGTPQQSQAPQYYPPLNNANPFLPAGQQQQNLNQQQQFQGYPNLGQIPFQTVSPTANPNQRVDRYPFLGGGLNNNNVQQQTGPNFPGGNTVLTPQTNEQYPGIPNFPFQTITPGGGLPPLPQPGQGTYPRIQLPKIRVIEFPASDFFEYGGGKLVQPKRPQSDLYVGGVGGDVPITSKIFVECTGPNQVEWIFNGTQQNKALSVVTKNFQITIPEQRDPASGSREYTYLRLGLEQQITEGDSGVYICRDRILPQNYISIRVLVAKPVTGKPHYPFKPRDPNTIYFSKSDSSVVLPCKIANEDAVISLHKHEDGKLSCPYPVDGRVTYDRFQGFTIQTQAFHNVEGRYVCVGTFNGELRLMKYKVVASEDFTTRYVDGDVQNIIALDSERKSSSGSASAPAKLLAQVDPVSNSVTPGLSQNLTALGFIDPRSEFDDETDTLFALPVEKSKSSTSAKPNKP